ncbi:hypothetical protein Q2T83_13905 [Fervidibacter sacchari]|uniref:Isocitrate dehydrogenase n=1 Tax=Candidatus Fervidibacter sacchari TaxID=1448929 RepID=A0ABT2EP10_9BACT|nr:hypothetical protein [Candidatus Fervidibacter sacchari]MCS3919702.1 isocitrate dehydrogenase [Candidatus Fervidibacter sacchari]WKU15416.1 hypothetical protein Q2T83_13905 [Candidatus Fervidibacter sacchari]
MSHILILRQTFGCISVPLLYSDNPSLVPRPSSLSIIVVRPNAIFA